MSYIAPGNGSFLPLPIHLQVVLLQPRSAKNNIFVPDCCNSEDGAFLVPLVAEDHVHYFSDGTSLIQRTVDVPYPNRCRKFLGFDLFLLCEVFQYEKASSSAIQEGLGGF